MRSASAARYIRKNGWKPVVAGDTAGAAQAGRRDGRPHAWRRWRRGWPPTLYGLDIVDENVEDTDNNVTRFVVLTEEQAMGRARRRRRQLMMTTFIFRVRNVPAALYKAMGGFATNGVNMTKLESYQLGGKFTATLFYADIEGHPDDRRRQRRRLRSCASSRARCASSASIRARTSFRAHAEAAD